MRHIFRRFLPGHEAVRDNRWLKPFASTLLHPRLWHLNRHSAAGGVAVGLFCGLIPGPLQMPTAALLAIGLRINLPLALLVTLYSNPLTIVPLYLVAFKLGQLALGDPGTSFVPPPDLVWAHLGDWIERCIAWAMGLGKPLGLGLVLLASILSACGYLVVRALWRIHLLRAWARRSRRKPRLPVD